MRKRPGGSTRRDVVHLRHLCRAKLPWTSGSRRRIFAHSSPPPFVPEGVFDTTGRVKQPIGLR